MTIREATEQDIATIVGLLKQSLGEGLMPKSEAFWRWKHIDNPFGRSPVLLAFEGNQLVGVRAFMRWEWTDGTTVVKSVRAVDTATHPDFQGKGIFKKLTLALVEQAKDEGISFVFNTPNSKSRPGYLKMGWEEAGKLPVRFSPVIPFLRSKNNVSIPFKDWFSKFGKPDIFRAERGKWQTNLTPAYLKWRYGDVPVASYRVVAADSLRSDCLIFRIKQSRLGAEMRIVDFIQSGVAFEPELWKKAKAGARETGCRFITYSGVQTEVKQGWLIPVGPMVTIRDLGYQEFSSLSNFKNWEPSLGDLELF